MKHIFVVNPKAGGYNHSSTIADSLRDIEADTELYRTTGPRDATRMVTQWCADHPGQAVRFYACGGDGTLNEVVTGVMNARSGEQKPEDVAVGSIPCGSGNDYARYWSDLDFHDIQALVNGPTVPVDVMEIVTHQSTRYCLNTLNFGFEAAVCRTMDEVHRRPIIGGPMAYTTGIIASLISRRHNPCRITVDGEEWFSGTLMLASLANGRYAGGGYQCAPKSVNDDGLLEVMGIRPMSIPRFAKVIKYYKTGEHLDHEELRNVMLYRRGRQVIIEDDGPFYLAIDGEVIGAHRFTVNNLHHAIPFIIPAKQS